MTATVAQPTDDPGTLTVFFDAECAWCRRAQHWLAHEPQRVPLRFANVHDERLLDLADPLPWLGAELVVVGEHGGVWIGPAAFLMCLWATQDHHAWATRLSGPSTAGLAERFFTTLSNQRHRFGGGPAPCHNGRCRHPQRA